MDDNSVLKLSESKEVKLIDQHRRLVRIFVEGQMVDLNGNKLVWLKTGEEFTYEGDSWEASRPGIFQLLDSDGGKRVLMHSYFLEHAMNGEIFRRCYLSGTDEEKMKKYWDDLFLAGSSQVLRRMNHRR